MVTTDDEELAWTARSFRDHGYDVKQRLSLLELEQKLPYIHNMVGWNYRMTEMQSAIGLAELARMDTWNMPRRKRNAKIVLDALKTSKLIKYFPVDTAERQNGWYVLAFSLAIEIMKCDIKQFVAAVAAGIETQARHANFGRARRCHSGSGLSAPTSLETKTCAKNFEMPRCSRMKRKRPSKFETTASWNRGCNFSNTPGTSG